MDNQKPNEGSGRNAGSEGSGSSMGKDQNSGNKGLGASGSASSHQDSKNTTNNAFDTKGTFDAKGSTDMSKSAGDMHKTIDKAADAAKPMAERLASTAHENVDKVQNVLSNASGSMDEKTKQLTEAYKTFADTGREYVRSSPATSVLVALAAGYTLSKLLGSRRH